MQSTPIRAPQASASGYVSAFRRSAAGFAFALASVPSVLAQPGRSVRRMLPAMLLLASAPLALEAGTITGRVVNKATGQYLRNASVQIQGTDRSVTTGDGGAFVIRDVPAGNVTLVVSYTGLDRAELSVAVPEQGTVTQDAELTSAAYGVGDDDTIVLGAFMVSSQREGDAAAIVQQRQAPNIKIAIAADAFGDVTEGNVGEFLKFLPGINVDYVDADVRAVRLRGLPPKYASVTVDGHPIATSASSSLDTGRQFEFEQVSLASVDIIENNKSPTADQIASGMAGNINVRSKSAFDQRGRRIKYSISGNYNEYGGSVFGESIGWDDHEHHKTLLNGSFEFSDTFFDDRLGIVAAYNHSGSYVRQLVMIGSHDFDNDPTNNETERPALRSWNFQDGPKPTWRDAMVLNLDFKATDTLWFKWNNSYNLYDAPFHNRNWVISSPANTWSNVTSDDVRSARTTPTAATSTTHTAQTQGSNLRKSGGTFITTPSVRWEATDELTVDGSVSYSRSYNDYYSGRNGYFSQATARMNGVAWEYEHSGENQLTIRQLGGATANTADILDLANYRDNLVVNNEERHSLDQFWTGNLDVTWRKEAWRMPSTFKFGADHRLNVRDIENFNPSWRMNINSALGTALNLANHNDPIRPSLRMGERVVGINGTAAAPPSLSEWSLWREFQNYNMDPFAVTATTAANGTTIASVTQPFFNTIGNVGANLRNKLQNNFDIKETVSSGYGMATVEVAPQTQAILGLRFETTETVGRSFDDIGDARAQQLAPMPTGYAGGIAQWRNNPAYVVARYGTRRDRSKSYDVALPSAQLRYEPRKNLVLRTAYFKSMLRPDFTNVVGGVTVNDAGTGFTVRNYELEPEFADNYDARVEYYFEPVGAISLGAFYKDIKDIQINVTDTFDASNPPQSIRDLGFDLPAGELTVTQRINGGKAAIWGLEFAYTQQLSFLSERLSGLSAFLNASYIRPRDPDIFALTAEDGIARETVNLGFNYRKGRFDGGIKANMVGERLRGVTGITVSPDGTITPATAVNSYRKEYLEARTQIDLNLSYELHRRTVLFVNVSNLFDVEQFRYNETQDWLTRWGQYGRRITFGVKGTF
jgi:iron complex outermembrane recepter protein